MKGWLARHGPALLSAVLLGAAFPPFNVFLLVFVGVAPLLARLRDLTGRQALASGFWFGLAYYLIQMYWVFGFVTDWIHKPVVALIPYIITALLGGLLVMPVGWLVNRCYAIGRPWLVPLVWAAGEGFRAYVPVLAFPWGLMATPLARQPWLVQHAAFGGVFLVSAWVVIVNLAVVHALFPDKNGQKAMSARQASSLALVFVAALLAGMLRLTNMPETKKLVVTLGQPGVDMAFTKGVERWQKLGTAARTTMATAQANGSQLVVFPEGFGEETSGDTPVSGVGARPPVPTILGSHRRAGDKIFQTAWLYDQTWKQADKTRLVVFGEYVPFRDSPLLANFNLPTADISPGEKIVTSEVAGTKVGTLVCFEGVFPDLSEAHARNGAQALVQISIDDWYIRTPAWEQLWMSSVWRSIENGLPLLRVGGEGMTMATDCRGRVLAWAKPYEPTALRVEVGVPAKSDAIPYKSVFLYICAAACLWVAGEGLVVGRKKSKDS
ncbi:MAG: apolipoprotein N-acyltransferase [Armatimonadetes bacterium]|nr:apolipoprotein N-acyltransferase [Armatimonadota bacterium]